MDRDGDSVVWLSGQLTESSSPTIVDGLQRLLRDSDCVVVDVSELAVEHPAALGILPAALQAAGGWPVAKLAVLSRDAVMSQALHASGVARLVVVVEASPFTRRQCDERPPEVRASWLLPADRGSPLQARRSVGIRLSMWGCADGLVAAAVQVANELVSNAVEHAGSRSQLDVGLDDAGLRCTVRDYSTTAPVLRVRDLESVGGYGLQLVDGLARSWGWTAHPDGKTIWALLSSPG